VSPRAQPYHHGNLRPVLVETAVELARTEGPDGVVLREVARRAGVSHNAAYRHFEDRAALLAEVSARAYDDLERAMRRRIDAVEEPEPVARAVARLRATGRAYVEFALSEPGLFATAFTSSTGRHTELPTPQAGAGHPVESPPQAAPPASGPYAVLNAVLDKLVACGAVSPERREGADVGCWAMVHGFAGLVGTGPLRELPPEARDVLLESVLDLVHRGLLV
jgi:AcrR family transcriptional regulator